MCVAYDLWMKLFKLRKERKKNRVRVSARKSNAFLASGIAFVMSSRAQHRGPIGRCVVCISLWVPCRGRPLKGVYCLQGVQLQSRGTTNRPLRCDFWTTLHNTGVVFRATEFSHSFKTIVINSAAFGDFSPQIRVYIRTHTASRFCFTSRRPEWIK